MTGKSIEDCLGGPKMIYGAGFSISMNQFRRLPGLLLLPCLFVLSPVEAGAETWTNALGRSFEAEFIRLHGEQAIFKLSNGRVFGKALKDLSPSSRERVTSGAAAGGSAPGGVLPAKTGLPGDRPGTGLTIVRPKTTNLGHSWPREVRVDAGSRSRVISEDREKRQFVYESPSYRFTANARITDDALRNFSMMFESTHKYARALPLGLNGGNQRDGKLDVLLFESVAEYQRAGGPPGSAGVYNSREGLVMVPFASLGLQEGVSGYSLNHARHNQVLIHELVHQVTPACYFRKGALGWFSEGVAEYVAISPYTWGRFGSDKSGYAVKSYVTGAGPKGRGGRGLGTRIRAPRLRSFFLMPYSSFSGRNANFNYGFALLVNHYFFHMEGGGKARRITEFLRGMHAGKTGEEALKPLLGRSTYESLQKDIAAHWGRQGVEIVFQ
jgi:hypothetical protein